MKIINLKIVIIKMMKMKMKMKRRTMIMIQEHRKEIDKIVMLMMLT